MIAFSLGTTNAFGHGLGSETMAPVALGSKFVILEISSSQIPDTEIREFSFNLFDLDTGITLNDVTYFIMVKKENKHLFEGTFQTDDGILLMHFIPTESKQVLVEEQDSGFFNSLAGPNKIISAKSSAFGSGGLYSFKVIIITAESYSNVISPAIDYDVGISVPDRVYFDINDINFGQQQLSIISYYDQINNDFNYNPIMKKSSYSMPFDWSKKNIVQTSVIHQELIVPKTFGDLMVNSLSTTINGLQVPDNVITIDDFSDEGRIIHLVLSQNELLRMSEELQNLSNKMEFAIMPSDDDLPLSTITENGQFRINLSWKPQNIESDSKAIFLFDIMDIFLLDRPVSVSYDLSIIHDGKKLFQTSGVSGDSKTEHNTIEFFIPDYVTGQIALQFENLNENSVANASLPVIVNRIEPNQPSSQILVPSWVKNNAGWWASDQITDNDFVKGIEYMIKEGIVKTGDTNSDDSSSQNIPAWIKNNAGWWAKGEIDDKTFVSGIQYLIKVGIIKIS
tara:strand:- start:5277 stop:6803 length:1527 start_codon:yes stop_codon:yes gene_type:complete